MTDSLYIEALQATGEIAKSAIDVMTDCLYQAESRIASDAQSLVTAAIYISSRLHAIKPDKIDAEVQRLRDLLSELESVAASAGV